MFGDCTSLEPWVSPPARPGGSRQVIAPVATGPSPGRRGETSGYCLPTPTSGFPPAGNSTFQNLLLITLTAHCAPDLASFGDLWGAVSKLRDGGDPCEAPWGRTPGHCLH